MTVLLPYLLGVLIALAVLTAVAGILGTPSLPEHPAADAANWLRGRIGGLRLGHLLVAVASGGFVWWATGWPVAAVAAVAGAIVLPALVRRRDAEDVIDKLEALQSWTRRIVDILTSGAGGLEQAITSSARTAPDALATEIAALAVSARTRGLEPALRAFADKLADPAVDEVVMALILRTRAGGRGLTDVLDAKATALAAEVANRREIEADRAKPRTNVRAITWITVGVIAGLIAFAHDYLSPFSSILGQLVMTGVVGIFAGAFWWMYTLSRARRAPRMLVNTRTVPTRRPTSPVRLGESAS